MLIVDTIQEDNGFRREVAIDMDALQLNIALITPTGTEIVQVNSVFKNLKILSASLTSHLGHGPSVDLLTRANVPVDSDLWDLNHSNPHRSIRNNGI